MCRFIWAGGFVLQPVNASLNLFKNENYKNIQRFQLKPVSYIMFIGRNNYNTIIKGE